METREKAIIEYSKGKSHLKSLNEGELTPFLIRTYEENETILKEEIKQLKSLLKFYMND